MSNWFRQVSPAPLDNVRVRIVAWRPLILPKARIRFNKGPSPLKCGAENVCHLALSPRMPDIYMPGRHRGGKMDATTSKLAESNRGDQFIPARKEDLLSALIKQGDLADP